MRRTLALAVLTSTACGPDRVCEFVARAYAATIADAQRCDPDAEDACRAIVRASLDAGSTWCERVAVDPAKQQAIDNLLGTFARDGCPLGPSPQCPNLAPADFQCRPSGSGTGTCVRR
jgi:hypothetical protein